jgi:hypothetical protein
MFVLINLIGWVGTDNVGREADLSYSPVHAPPAGVNVEVFPPFFPSSSLVKVDKYLVVCLGLCHLCH